MSDIILSVKDITKHFRHIRALDGVSAEVREGSITAIVGDNGSGKSTLIKILSGTLRPDGGSMTVCGAEHPFLTVQRALAGQLQKQRGKHIPRGRTHARPVFRQESHAP